MKAVVAVLMGLASGLLLYMIVGMAWTNPTHAGRPSAAVILIVLVGGSVASGAWLLRGAGTTRTVLRRGLLLGAGEWVVMAGIGPVAALRNSAALIAGTGVSGARAATATQGGYIAAVLALLGSLVVAALCWVIYKLIDPARRNIKVGTVSAPVPSPAK